MGGNRNKRGGRELSSAHPYGGGARPGMVTGIYYKLNLRTRITTRTTTITMRSGEMSIRSSKIRFWGVEPGRCAGLTT
jgi:hypothetical protein